MKMREDKNMSEDEKKFDLEEDDLGLDALDDDLEED